MIFKCFKYILSCQSASGLSESTLQRCRPHQLPYSGVIVPLHFLTLEQLMLPAFFCCCCPQRRFGQCLRIANVGCAQLCPFLATSCDGPCRGYVMVPFTVTESWPGRENTAFEMKAKLKDREDLTVTNPDWVKGAPHKPHHILQLDENGCT